MNTKKPLLALAAVACFALTSCTSNATSDESIYENQSIDQTKIKKPVHGIDQTKIKKPVHG